jgi:hypothetical protein
MTRDYLGYAEDVDRRVAEHLGCGVKSSPLVWAALGAGCTVTVAAVFAGKTRTDERRCKRRGGLGRVCPTCRAAGYSRR